MRKENISINDILNQHRKLCDWCDEFFEGVIQKYGQKIQCHEGCCYCCTLQSVSHLEAHIIEDFIQTHDITGDAKAKQTCLFLNNGRCSIYDVRPLICRTHGLILYDSEENSLHRTCDLNFDMELPTSFRKEEALDSFKVTENLTRLNLLYCIAQGHEDLVTERVSFRDLVKNLKSRVRSSLR